MSGQPSSPGARRRVTLRRFAAVPLAPGVVRAGTVVDGEALTEALKELWSLGKFGTKERHASASRTPA